MATTPKTCDSDARSKCIQAYKNTTLPALADNPDSSIAELRQVLVHQGILFGSTVIALRSDADRERLVVVARNHGFVTFMPSSIGSNDDAPVHNNKALTFHFNLIAQLSHRVPSRSYPKHRSTSLRNSYCPNSWAPILVGMMASVTPALSNCVDHAPTHVKVQVENFLAAPKSLLESINNPLQLRNTIAELVISDARRSLPELMKQLRGLSQEQRIAIGIGLGIADRTCMEADPRIATLIRTTVREAHDSQLSRAYASVTDPDPSLGNPVQAPTSSLSLQPPQIGNSTRNTAAFGGISNRKATRVYSLGDGKLWNPLASLPMRRPWDSLNAHDNSLRTE